MALLHVFFYSSENCQMVKWIDSNSQYTTCVSIEAPEFVEIHFSFLTGFKRIVWKEGASCILLQEDLHEMPMRVFETCACSSCLSGGVLRMGQRIKHVDDTSWHAFWVPNIGNLPYNSSLWQLIIAKTWWLTYRWKGVYHGIPSF